MSWFTWTDLDETPVNGAQVAALLHGDEAKMVLLVYPGQESLVLVVEDATPDVPVFVATGVAKNAGNIRKNICNKNGQNFLVIKALSTIINVC